LKIFIDPGHGGRDRANRSPTGYVEADGTLDISARMRQLLEKQPGIEVMMSREADETVSLQERSRMANKWGADLFTSIHTNAAGSPDVGGIEIFHSHNGEWGNKFSADARKSAVFVLEELLKMTGLRNRGVKTRLVTAKDSPFYAMDHYAVIRRTKSPAIIAEIGFHTNPSEEALLKTASFRQKAAEAMAAGIMNYVNYKKENKGEPDLFTDVPETHWAVNAIKFVSEMDQPIMSGFADGSFRPNEPVSRAQLAVIMQRFYNFLK